MEILKKKRAEIGSCSACQCREHTVVYSIDLNNVIIRLCEGCKDELITRLNAARRLPVCRA